MQRIEGWVELGNRTITVSGIVSSSNTPVQRSYPLSTITVYLTGTLTLASIYSDNAGSAKANPFTADATGFYFFYVADGAYDVKLSGDGLPAPFTLGPDSAFDQANSWINVKSSPYFAQGDGVTDDTAAITAAINAAISSKFRVFFPPGTYIVAPTSTTQILPIGSNVWIQGSGMGVSTLKVKANGGSYKAFFGPEFVVASSITLSDFTIDQNSANNPAPSGGDLSTNPRIILAAATGSSNITIQNMEILNMQNINTFYMQVTHGSVVNCRFNIYGGGSIYHDHSTLYMAADGALITGNQFQGLVNGAGSVTAIETHGGHQTVTGNVIDSYEIGMNITGVALTDSEGISVTGNTITNGYYGIFLWSVKYSTHTTGYGINGATVTGNVIRLVQDTWTTNPGSGASFIGNPSGIVLYPVSNLPFKDVNILGNTIVYDLESGSTPVDTSGFGIGYWDSTNLNTFDGLRISGNMIHNCPTAAIRVSSQGSKLDVSNNQIVNPGSSLNVGLTNAFRVGVFVASFTTAITDVLISDNNISDNIDTTRMTSGIGLYIALSPNVVLDNNFTSVTGTVTTAFITPLLVNSATQVPRVRDTVYAPNSSSLLPTGTLMQGSLITDLANRKIYRARANGTSYNQSTTGSAAPSTGTWAVGDFVQNEAPSSSTYFGGSAPVVGWICTSAGTPGTWISMAATDPGNPASNFTFSNNKIVYWENFAGGGGIPVIWVDTSDVVHLTESTYKLQIKGGLLLSGNEITTAGGQISFGNQQGVGNAGSVAVNAPGHGTGGGPATPGTIVTWLKINFNGATGWVPVAL